VDKNLAQCNCCGLLERRGVLKAAVAVWLGFDLAPLAAAQGSEAASSRPQPGDQLVYADGQGQGKVIAVTDLQPGDRPVSAFPMDPGSRLVRDGSRLNKILLVRLDPDTLSAESRARAVEGMTAYSAICTHQGCEVGGWEAERKLLWCPCHDSKFDPRESGRVAEGPAPKRLAALPLKTADGTLTVAAGFTGPVGFQNR
jgi:rieske iron-sulfur protein